ncbi:MAG: hypothetical protein AAF203_09740 [Pseudomonadota bacterium]
MKMLSLFLTMIFLSPSAMAFFSLMDTGQLVDEGSYRAQGESQILFDSPEGFNLNGRFSTGFDDESEFQFEGGVGSVDFYMAAFYKWIPFPDTSDQPAIGFRGGVTFAELNNYSTYGFNFTPMISKVIDTDLGDITPFGGMQLGLQKNTFETFFSMQIALGIQWSPSEWDFRSLKDFDFLLEYGIEVDDSFSYLSFGAAYNF